MKIAILTSGLGNRGGSERTILVKAKELDADIYAGRYYPEKTFSEFKKLNVTVLHKDIKFLGRRINSLIIRNKFKKLRLTGYDIYFYHGGHSLAAAPNHENNIWYCHAPTRWLYDLWHETLQKQKGIMYYVFLVYTHILRNQDQYFVTYIDQIICNSVNTQMKVKKYYGINARKET